MSADTSHLTEVLQGFTVAMLASTDPATNILHARPMQILRIEPTGVLWFATKRDAAKVGECTARNAPVLCTMQSGPTYVSLSGHAETVCDQVVAKDLWDEKLRPWFPDGPSDSTYLLLRFTPQVGEYWDFSGVKRRLSLLLQEGRALFTGAKAEPDKLGAHEKITMPMNTNPIA